MRLFGYKMTSDTGFAPNPFYGSLTLATCKPGIRRTKELGDWIAGFTSGQLNGDAVGAERLVFLMKVDEKKSIAEYFLDPRFKNKIPRMNGDAVSRAGDNIYRPLRRNAAAPQHFEQVLNPHHWDDVGSCVGPGPSKGHDVSGLFVLVARTFAYFGGNALVIPPRLRPEVPRGQSPNGSRTKDERRSGAFIEYVLGRAAKRGEIGKPHDWPGERHRC